MRARKAAPWRGSRRCRAPRIAHVRMSRPSRRAACTSPALERRRRMRMASSADDGTCAWTPQSLSTTSCGARLPTGSSRWRPSRQARTWPHESEVAISWRRRDRSMRLPVRLRLLALVADAHDAEVAQVDVEATRSLHLGDELAHVVSVDLPGALADG